MPYTAKQKTNFPEPYHTQHQPSAWSINSSDKSAEPSYIGSSEAAGAEAGHVQDIAGSRMASPRNDHKAYNAEPLGSAPQSGEGINAGRKPEGSGLDPELADYF